MGGARHSGEDEPRTPRGELTRIRESRERQDEEIKGRIEAAMLEATGSEGYRRVSVQNVIDAYGGNRVQFYRHFAGKSECYVAAHAVEIERLSNLLLEAMRSAPSWRLGLRAALVELADYVARGPAAARGLLVEVHVAGGEALAKRAEICGRLEVAMDEGRREAGGGADRPSTLTAGFMLAAIDSTLTRALVAGEPQAFAAEIPELTHMIVAAYLGEDGAAEELAAASAA